MSDDTDSNVINLPTRGGDSGGMPEVPDAGDLFYSEPSGSSADGCAPPEPPEGATRELPVIRGPISPEVALRETGMPGVPDSVEEECEEGEYEQPRSLADRLGDWLELRLEVARDRHAGEAPFREAEIARKTALLEARTAQETALMEQNAKLHTAQMKAKSDKTAARGKADAARSSGSGMGTDKGGRSKAGGGSGSRSGGGSGGTGRGSGGDRGSGRASGPGGGNSPKGTGKGSDRPAGGRGGPSKGNESSGSSRGRQNGSGGSGKSGSGKGSSSGSGGKNGSGGSGGGKGGAKADGSRTHNSPATSPRAERARGRQERAAARQAARHQRRSTDQAANLADRSKDRDQDRANQQAAREERRKAKAERKAARKAKREAAKAAGGRTTLGAAVAEEAQRRWEERRAASKDKAAEKDKAAKGDTADGQAKDSTSGKDSEATTKKASKDRPEPAADGTTDDSVTKEPDDGEKTGERPADGSGDTDAKDGTGTADAPKSGDAQAPPGTDDSDDSRSFKEKLKDFFTKAGEDTTPEPEEPSRRAAPEDFGVTVDRPDRPEEPSVPSEAAEEDIPDAVIVDDPADPFGATVTTAASLPRAPEPHTQRPGTTRPTPEESNVSTQRAPSGQGGLAAKHRTSITFDEYLVEMANIASAADKDREQAQDLANALAKVADALRELSADLVGDHNIITQVTSQIADLADLAATMKAQAERSATECEVAFEAARIAAVSVARTYGEDLQAMENAGLAYASASAHHD